MKRAGMIVKIYVKIRIMKFFLLQKHIFHKSKTKKKEKNYWQTN